MRAGLVVAFALAAGSCGRGCSTCGAPGSGAPPANAVPGASVAPSAARDGGQGRLTPPLGGTAVRGAVVVAALDPARGAVAVARFERDTEAWRVDVLAGVKASPVAAIQAQASGDDVAVFWRGPRDGRAATDATLVAPDGGLRVAAFAAGSPSCATEGGVVWIETSAKEDARVRVRGVDGGVVAAARVPSDREIELACGARRAFVLARGDDDLSVVGFEVGAAARTDVLARAADPLEEEREHAVFVTGDELGVVRVAASGTLQWREVNGAGAGPWRRITARLAKEDDLVALDASAGALVLVTTREAGEGVRVEAVHVDRATGAATVLALGAAHEPSGFSVMPAGGALVVAWAEGGALVARRIDAAGALGPPLRAEIGDAAFVPLDCTDAHCRVAVLDREGAPRVVSLALSH